MGLKWVEQGFSSFFTKFLAYIWAFYKVSQLLHSSPLWKTIKYISKMWKKMKKSLVQLALIPFFPHHIQNPKSRFRLPVPSLVQIYINVLIFNVFRTGSLLATTCKDKKLRIIDPRSGEVLRKGDSHQGNKASKVSIYELSEIHSWNSFTLQK